MTLVKQKLRSQGGASIVLALLLLLLCIMVGSSILAAGMSNAGKTLRSREARQEYFAVRSALELVCEELEKMEYKGKYIYSGSEDATPGDEHYELKYKMMSGTLSGITPPGALSPLDIDLPGDFKDALSDEFDRLYAVAFYNAVDLADEGAYRREYTQDVDPNFEKDALGNDILVDGKKVPAKKQTAAHKFTVKINGSGSIPKFDLNKPLKETVDITVEIAEGDLSLKVTAEINGTHSNKMEALMRLASGSVFTVPTESDVPVSSAERHPTALTWETKYIRKAVDR